MAFVFSTYPEHKFIRLCICICNVHFSDFILNFHPKSQISTRGGPRDKVETFVEAINSSAWVCFPRPLSLSRGPSSPPRSFPSLVSDSPWDHPNPTETATWRGMRQKSFAYAVLGFVCPFRRGCDRGRDNRLTSKRVEELLRRKEAEIGESDVLLANCDLTFAAPRVTSKKGSPECSIPRGPSHSARGSRDRVPPPSPSQPQEQRDLSSQVCLCAMPFQPSSRGRTGAQLATKR